MNRPRVLSQVVKGISDPIFGKKSTMYARIVTNWSKIVGKDTAAYALPLELKFSKSAKEKHNTATLKIGVNSARAQDIVMQKDLLIEKINQFMGFSAIKDIQITHQSQNLVEKTKKSLPKVKNLRLNDTEEKALAQTLGNIENDELKSALDRLGHAVYSRQKASNSLEK